MTALRKMSAVGGRCGGRRSGKESCKEYAIKFAMEDVRPASQGTKWWAKQRQRLQNEMRGTPLLFQNIPSNHLALLRRDLNAYYIDHLLKEVLRNSGRKGMQQPELRDQF